MGVVAFGPVASATSATSCADNEQEYCAQGVQNWYDIHDREISGGGIHNEIDTQEELESYDPTLHALIEELLPQTTTFDVCHRR